ncbi:hypothetical protein ACFQLX_20225 [Streptomyces polyrhachis]|uniref:Knr4/Smi1-like domain-containing protein n=1 Tax=Streptomyces polyrhachis TaxID=1282885 RepID=A0ABW2GLT7_9ACTN
MKLDTRQSIELLWRQVVEIGRPIVRFRNPGIAKIQLEAAIGVTVPDDVVAWFESCNGARFEPGQRQDDVYLIPAFEPLSVEQALEMRRIYGDGDPILGESWFPLLGNASGDMYAAVWDASDTPPRVAVVISESFPQISYSSVQEMAISFLECYRRGVFFVKDGGLLDVDVQKWEEVDMEVRARLE